MEKLTRHRSVIGVVPIAANDACELKPCTYFVAHAELALGSEVVRRVDSLRQLMSAAERLARS